MPTGVIIIGMKNTTRKKRRPASFCAHRKARPRPIRYCTATPPKT